MALNSLESVCICCTLCSGFLQCFGGHAYVYQDTFVLFLNFSYPFQFCLLSGLSYGFGDAIIIWVIFKNYVIFACLNGITSIFFILSISIMEDDLVIVRQRKCFSNSSENVVGIVKKTLQKICVDLHRLPWPGHPHHLHCQVQLPSHSLHFHYHHPHHLEEQVPVVQQQGD